MPHEVDPFSAPISKRRPLLGVTILLVEDSRTCSEAVRLMTLRSGARLRRADCIRSARKHLASYRPDLVIVDLGLPDGSGLDLIRDVQSDGMAILAISGTIEDDVREAVKDAGATGFLPKPLGNIKQFQNVVGSAIRGGDPIPGFLPSIVDDLPELDLQALVDDLDHVHDILAKAVPQNDTGRIQYCAQFVASIAQTTHDQTLMTHAAAFFQKMEAGETGLRDGQTFLELIETKMGEIPKDAIATQGAA